MRYESTPHARGSTLPGLLGPLYLYVYPACAGIHPMLKIFSLCCLSLPRMRGDPPCCLTFHKQGSMSTPHARGSTPTPARYSSMLVVYPACAGIHLRKYSDSLLMFRLPRMRGDPPPRDGIGFLNIVSTPHARGSTLGQAPLDDVGYVYPACAGIHPCRRLRLCWMSCLPRMRGDPPAWNSAVDHISESTPHARGSTHCDYIEVGEGLVYPACAGIHRSQYLCLDT